MGLKQWKVKLGTLIMLKKTGNFLGILVCSFLRKKFRILRVVEVSILPKLCGFREL